MTAARVQRGLDQAELARLAGCVPSHVSGLEAGKHGVSVRLAARLAEACRVSLDWLTGGEPGPTDPR